MDLEQTVVELSEIFDSNGLYTVYSVIMAIYSSVLIGTATVIVELLAPAVTIRWDWDSSPTNSTVFPSTNCVMRDILGLNVSRNSSAASVLLYETPYSKRTLTEELDLVCERSWLVSLANALAFAGVFVGLPLTGRIAEIYGRKPVCLILIILTALSNLVMLFSRNYTMFVVSVFILGFSTVNCGNLLFIQALEIIPKSSVPYLGTITKSGTLTGQILLVSAAWLIKDWFYTQLFHAVLAVICCVLTFYMLESPLWLAVRMRYDDAEDAIRKILKRNRRDVQALQSKVEIWLQQMKASGANRNQTTEVGRLCDLFKNRVITFYVCSLTFVTTTVILTSTSLLVNTESFGTGLYLDLTISNAMALGALILVTISLWKTSIRTVMMILFILEGATCAMYPIFYGNTLARTIIPIFARCFITPPISLSYVYLAEILPTSVRVVGCSVVIALSSAISALAPFTKELGQLTEVYVPFILFAVLSFTSAFILKFLPDTRGKALVHTVDELQQIRNEGKAVQNYTNDQ